MFDYDNTYYMSGLYNLAYKILLLNPWKNVNYFDFYLVEPDDSGCDKKYILNLENYNAEDGSGKTSSMRTVWVHILESIVGSCKLKAFCCVYTAKENIPKIYHNETLYHSKWAVSEACVPFYVNFTGGEPRPIDWIDAKQYYFIIDTVYKFLLKLKIAGSDF